MNHYVLFFMVLMIASSQCMFFVVSFNLDCGRYTSSCTRFGSMYKLVFDVSDVGQRVVYKVGIDNDVVASLSQVTRFYSSSDCSNDPLLALTTVYVCIYVFE